MIGETNINGGAGLNGKGALLKIKAETGSTITVSKGSYFKTIKVSQLDPDDNNWSYWLFQTTDFGEWTVTATLSGGTISDTVTISSNAQYDIISYHVPPEYREVEYIEATGTQYINYGISPAIIFSAEFEFALTSTSLNRPLGINNTNGGGTGYRANLGSDTSRRFYLWAAVDNTDQPSRTIPTSYNIGEFVKLKYSQGSGFQKLEIGSESVTSSYNTAAKTACWSFLYKGGSNYYGDGRLKHSKLWNNGILVRDMWACYRKSDSVAGMWDKVSQTFITNAGSGVFTVGPDVRGDS